MTFRRVRIDVHGNASPAGTALQLSLRRTADSRAWLIFQCLMCRRTFEVRLGDRGEHLCRH
jgi:hypothetical protein